GGGGWASVGMVQVLDSGAGSVPLQGALGLGVWPAGPPDSATLYEPTESVTFVPAALPGNGVMGEPLLVTVICHAPASAVPPLSFTTCLITLSVAVGVTLSSLVMVQILVCARASVPEQPTAPVLLYPATVASSTLYVPALTVPFAPRARRGVVGPGLGVRVWGMSMAAGLMAPASLLM